jgi:4-amino-4-deoxy-L-arabinose transferase-like glycosyltransferase
MAGSRRALPARWIVAAVGAIAVMVALFSDRPPASEDLLLRDVAAREAGGEGDRGLFVHADDGRWYPPLAVYPTAALMQLGLSVDLAMRVIFATAAALLLVTTYLLVTRVDARAAMSSWAVVLLALTPAFVWSFSQSGAELLMASLVLFWCGSVLGYLQQPRRWWLLAGGAALGLCAYAHPAGPLTLGVYFAIGAVILIRAGAGYRAALLASAAVFVVLLPIALWLALTPEAYPDTFGRWAIHLAHVRNPVDGVIAFTRWPVLARRVGVYWEYLSPTVLFTNGEVFGFAMLLLVALGLWVLTRRPLTSGQWVVVAGFFAAPLAGVLLDEPRSVSLVSPMVPFGATLAAYGVETLRQSPRRAVRTLLLLVFGLLVLELTHAAK